MKKFELTTETKINICGKKLFRIKALISFGLIIAGEKGGWIEKEENLSQYGNASNTYLTIKCKKYHHIR